MSTRQTPRREQPLTMPPLGSDPNELLDQMDVARLFKVTAKMLEARRLRGDFVPFIRIGSLIRYRREDVVAFIESHRTPSIPARVK